MELNIETIEFSKHGDSDSSESYEYSSGDWVEWSWDGSDVYGKVRDRTKDSFTVDGNKITGEDGEPVYKMEEYDAEKNEFTDQMVAKPQSSLNSWQGPQNNSLSVEVVEFATERDREKIASMWEEMVSMDEDQMEMWDDHPCADAGVDGGENIRDETLMLMGQWPNGWDENSYRIANKHLAHIANSMDMEPPEDAMDGGPGTCPTRWAVNLLNRGVNPFDQMPGGNPEFSETSSGLSFESAGGVTWEDTMDGKLEESEIPNEGFEPHYMYAEDTKGESSYPLVDGNGNLRRGNVESAWGLGGQGAPVSGEEHDRRVKEIAQAFDNPPVPEEEMDMSVDVARLNELEFEVDQEELDSTYSEWSDEVNMTASGLDSWSDHPCANEASQDPQAVRERNMMLLETDKSDWTQKHIDAANRTISFISRMRGQRPDSPKEGGPGTCPSEWAISLLNWAYNPFDGMPGGDPDGEQENSTAEDLDDSAIAFAASQIRPQRPDLSGFNEYGVRENTNDEGELMSVDAVYEAMEPGEPEDRNGVRITKQFLKNVAEKDYSDSPPYLMDHDRSTLSQVGFVKDVWYSTAKEKLMVMARAYNVGSDIHDEVVSRLTFEPPTIPDGSVGFGDSFDYERNDSGEVVLTDGRIQEFSTTPFPGGYDSGGLDVDYIDDQPEATVVIGSS
jgi:hypothetical protein